MTNRRRVAKPSVARTKEKGNKVEQYKHITFKNEEQRKAYDALKTNSIVFLTGIAGTGKTFLAVSYAVEEFIHCNYKKIILSRPIIEAGERLGSLPGEVEEKIHPYMIPLMDMLNEKLDPKFVKDMFENNIFELTPLAYMRGRTFKDAIVILDEAQNATREQLLMFLTRIGPGTKMVISGDYSQSDINGRGRLEQVAEKLSSIGTIDNVVLTQTVRHPLIQHIFEAFQHINK